MTYLWSHSWNQRALIQTKVWLQLSTYFSHYLHCLSRHLLKILPRYRMDGFKYGAGEDLRRSIARWSDFPQLGRRVGIRASVASENKFISRLGKGPSGGAGEEGGPCLWPWRAAYFAC